MCSSPSECVRYVPVPLSVFDVFQSLSSFQVSRIYLVKIHAVFMAKLNLYVFPSLWVCVMCSSPSECVRCVPVRVCEMCSSSSKCVRCVPVPLSVWDVFQSLWVWVCSSSPECLWCVSVPLSVWDEFQSLWVQAMWCVPVPLSASDVMCSIISLLLGPRHSKTRPF